MPKLTDWFPGSVKPVRVGVYRRDYGDDRYGARNFCFWNGRYWGYAASSPQAAKWHDVSFSPSLEQGLPWCGLTEPGE